MTDSKPKILCLEDDNYFCEFYTKLFSSEYDVVCVDSVLNAERLLKTQDIRLALVDMSLIPNDAKDTGGFQFLESLHSLGLVLDIPTIVITAYETTKVMRKAFRDYGVKDFFSKQELIPAELKKAVESSIAIRYEKKEFGEIPRVLVIEDDAYWREKLIGLLKSEGCAVDVADTYEAAINMISSSTYNLATVDIRLNDLDTKDARGFELLDMAKRIGLSIDSIIVSAFATPEQVALAEEELGALSFISKQEFNRVLFLRKVRRFLYRQFYVYVDLKVEEKSTPLKVGKEHNLLVGISKTKPQQNYIRLLARPTMVGAFELEVVVHPYYVDVLPGSTQFLTVMSDDNAEPISYQIIPTETGKMELVIDLYYHSKMMARMAIPKEVEG